MTSTNAPRLFPATHWSVVLAARGGDDTDSMRALETLCRAYWYPLYAYLRRQGHSPHDAQDLTQGFFARLLEKHYLDAVDRDKGRFRSFLLMALKRFLAKEWERDHAQKRGGGQVALSLDTELAERRYQGEGAEHLAPDRMYGAKMGDDPAGTSPGGIAAGLPGARARGGVRLSERLPDGGAGRDPLRRGGGATRDD